jgi:hypothetical protein
MVAGAAEVVDRLAGARLAGAFFASAPSAVGLFLAAAFFVLEVTVVREPELAAATCFVANGDEDVRGVRVERSAESAG